MAVLERAFIELSRRWRALRPCAALILGSGWSAVADALDPREGVPYADIPGLGSPTVEGHAGRLRWAGPASSALLIFEGRRHWYEGQGWGPIALPVYLARRWGARFLVLTNAAGGLHRHFRAGDLMVVADHLNLMGVHPLVGPHEPFWGPRFVDQTEVYDAEMRQWLHEAAIGAGVALHEGVYAAVSGPTYETPAEVEMLRRLGVDAVGMSTVPEAILGHAAGLRVAAVSCITNLAAGVATHRLTHEDVVRATADALPRMQALLAAFWHRLQREAREAP